ncbi:WXG100 family type VII secretion target [Streptomyces sp. NPDC048434]|uniref:WXG100 family type VII secretion target n=1 Tax=Streptomyces sp. NPDC048434 TaxID=3365549 RepID=UPI00370FECCC
MANQTTNVDIEGMKRALPAFETALSETTRVHNNMQAQAGTLGGTWTGDSAQIFVRALNAWLENCNVVRQELQKVTEKLEAATGNYGHVHANASDASSALQQAVAGGLPGFS